MSDILLEPSEKLESVYCPVYSHPVKLGEYGVQEGFKISEMHGPCRYRAKKVYIYIRYKKSKLILKLYGF